MTKPAVRDYRVGGPEADRAIADGLVEAEWFRPPIDPERLSALQIRNNYRAAIDTIAWLGLLTVFGYLAFLSLGTWWAIAAFAAYGSIYGGAGDSRWHESGHGTAFRTKWLNDCVYYLASFMLLRQPTLWRWSHVRHHTDTIVVGRDNEIVLARPASMASVALVFVPVVIVPKMLFRSAKHAFGHIDEQARSFVPADEFNKLKWESRALIAILAGITAWSIATSSVVPLLYIGLPTIYGAWIMAFFAISQHVGLQEDVLDHRLNTRTIYMNPVLRFFYSNMNYHVEHHIFPTVPYYALPALHEQVKEYLAPPAPNTLVAYREIFANLRRQRKDPSFDAPRNHLPNTTSTARSPVDTGHTLWASKCYDGLFDLCAASDLTPGSARQIHVEDHLYALFRLKDGSLVCSDGLCTHGHAYLAEGVLLDCLVECPKHNGRFDLRTGQALRKPATKPLAIYPTEIRNGRVVSNLKPTNTPLP